MEVGRQTEALRNLHGFDNVFHFQFMEAILLVGCAVLPGKTDSRMALQPNRLVGNLEIYIELLLIIEFSVE